MKIGDLVRQKGSAHVGVIIRELVPSGKTKRFIVHWGDHYSARVSFVLEVIA